MRGAVLGLLVGLSVATTVRGAPDSGSRAVQKCLAGCDASESETDRATCRITCEERQNAKEQPDIVRWEREELKGGSPDPTVERGSKTTITEISPSGTKTRVITERKPGIVAPRRRWSPRGVAHIACQSRCDRLTEFPARAGCRLQCSEREYRRRSSRTRSAGRRPASKTKTKTTQPQARRANRACSSKCLRSASTCRDRCAGSDRSTCELQCDQSLSSCERRC